MATTNTTSANTTPAMQNNTSQASTNTLLAKLQQDGFVHIPSLIPPEQIESLRQASSHITQLTREGKWSYFRTVPKQFPPWPKEVPPESEGSIWGVQHLLHPSMPNRNEFARLYFSDAVLDVVKQLLLPDLPLPSPSRDEESDSHLVMELFNLLVSPTNIPFELVWHRDDVRPDLSPTEELSQLQSKSPSGRQAHAQYNISLYDDNSLIVVPGSHRRVRTEIERTADPKAATLPDMVVVKMKPGDAVFYDSNILHRGVYEGVDPSSGEPGRLTLHGSVGLAGHGKERARAVLQHAVGEWIGKDGADFGGLGDEKLARRAEDMRERLRAIGSSGEDVGYSLEG